MSDGELTTADSQSTTLFATTTVVAVVIAVAVTIGRKVRQRRWLFSIIPEKKPFESLPMPPLVSWLTGHLSLFGRFFKETVVNDKVDPLFVEYTNKYGQCGIWLGPKKAVVVTQAEDAQTVLAAEYYRKPAPFLARHGHFFLGAKNIGFLQGREWRQNRSAIIRSISPASTLENARRAMLDVANTFVLSCKDKITGSDKNYIESPIENFMKMITIDIFAKSSLGVDLGCSRTLQASPIAVAFDHLLDELTTRILDPFNPFNYFYSLPTDRNCKHHQERAVVRSFLEDLIHERRQQLCDSTRSSSSPSRTSSSETSSKHDVLANLMHVESENKTMNSKNKKNTSNNSSSSSRDDVIDQTLDDTLMALLFAGYDTTSITLTYAMWSVSQHPEVEEKCLEEISHAKKAYGSSRTRESMERNHTDVNDKEKTGLDPNDLVYCRAVIMETLRLYPPAGMTTRHLTKPIKLRGDTTIPTGSAALVYIEHIQRSERHFPRPNDFVPERWVQKKSNTKDMPGVSNPSRQLWEERFTTSDKSSQSSSISRQEEDDEVDITIAPADRSAFLAFSAGGRACPGTKFALQESSLVLATLLLDLTFTPSQIDYVLNPVRKGLIQHPDDGIPMTIKIRCND
mmetsp:Transcript_30375/g.73863  ORF Transcript_30375/g.73863 Transcript_30375/m.73863 type:complete len:627 (+) Transcript_30375:136-2016(+)